MADAIQRANDLCARIRHEKAQRAAGISKRPTSTGYRNPPRLSFDELESFQSSRREYPKTAPTSAEHLRQWEESEQANRALPPEEQIDG